MSNKEENIACLKRIALPNFLLYIPSEKASNKILQKAVEMAQDAEDGDIYVYNEEEVTRIFKALKEVGLYNDFELYWESYLSSDNSDLVDLAEALGEELYYESRKSFLQLHDRHLLWEIDGNDEEGDFDEFWGRVVCDSIEDFMEKTGVELFTLGRSGRHVCVELTLDNIINYYELQQKANEYADKLVKYFNDK